MFWLKVSMKCILRVISRKQASRITMQLLQFSQNLPIERSILKTDFSFTKNEKRRNLFISKLQENLNEKFGDPTDINIAT